MSTIYICLNPAIILSAVNYMSNINDHAKISLLVYRVKTYLMCWDSFYQTLANTTNLFFSTAAKVLVFAQVN